MEKTVKILLALTCLFLGVIIGFICSPIKRGMYCGNHNGNVYGGNELGYDPNEWDEDDDIDAVANDQDIPF